MKQLLLVFCIVSFLNEAFSQNQGEVCSNPILINCNNTITSTPSHATNLTAFTGNDYSCLSSGPNDTTSLQNAQWLYLKTSDDGFIAGLGFDMQTSGNYYSYVIYGPFNSYSDMIGNCNALGSASAPIIACHDSIQSPTGWSLYSPANNQEQFFLMLFTSDTSGFKVNLGQISTSSSLTIPNLPIIDQSVCPGSHNFNIKTFIDQNQNGIFDNNESIFYTSSTIPSITPAPQYWYNLGSFLFTVNYDFVIINPGAPTTHTITSPAFNNFIYTTPNSYSITVDSVNLTYDTLFFGLYPSSTVSDITHGFPLQNAITHCVLGGSAFSAVSNSGTQPFVSVDLEIIIDPALSLQSASTQNMASITPTSVVNNSHFFSLDTLDVFSSEFLNLNLLPDSAVLSTDTIIPIYSIMTAVDNLGNTFTDTDTLQLLTVCSYDPNTKLVFPNGKNSEEYIKLSDNLEYIIRFQNTGSSLAVDVKLIDTISDHLDLNTFQFINSDHNADVTIDANNRIITFMHQNIYLPDSATDPLGSHGYVRYRIKPKQTLLPKTEIRNFADIYFDFNAPVRTDTALSIVECYIDPNISISQSDDNWDILLVNNVNLESYRWYFNGDLISNQNSYFTQISENGMYTVIVTDEYGCEFSADFLVDYASVEHNSLGELKIYPIPSNGLINIELDHSEIQNIFILDALGKQINNYQGLNTSKVLLNEHNLSKGIYFIQIMDEFDNTITKRLIIE